MEVINTYYVIPRNAEQNECEEKLRNYFNPEKDNAKTKIHDNCIEIKVFPTGWIPFNFIYRKSTYTGSYRLSFKNAKNKRDAGFYLDIKFHYKKNKKQNLIVFSEFIKDLLQIKGDSFYLTTLNDEVSSYFREISYKKVSTYERKLRELFLVLLVPKEGSGWVNEASINGKHVKKVRNLADKEYDIERGLEVINLNELEQLLFAPICSYELDDYSSVFNLKEIETYSKEELISLIEKNQPISFWEKEIQKYVKIDEISTRTRRIRKARNKIAHHKYFTSYDHQELSADLYYMIDKIDQAITQIKSNHIDALLDLATINEGLSSVSKALREALTIDFSAIINSLIDPISSVRTHLIDNDFES